MTFDHTEQQGSEDRHRSRELSLERSTPPARVTGFELTQFLGAGAYGEVWIGVDTKTGRRVAIKFFHHRGGLDWPLLSREVEKLVFLSADRYVVQLLDVGWDADPPYFVMEYVENGSLDKYLRQEGPLPLNRAVDLFREIAVGLMHAHAKGVLHCDLKPANVLLDQDNQPRLADFGQSRLSHEQSPSLGTLFYMAPEQADLEAVPDAQWDVYAAGAMLWTMLSGVPPYYEEGALGRINAADSLEDRLAEYRRYLRKAEPIDFRKAGIDSSLAAILERCLARDPRQRFANIPEILNALLARDAARQRRPLVILGILGPLLLILVMALFSWRGYRNALDDSDVAVRAKVRESSGFAAQFVAARVAHEIDRYFRAVEFAASDPELQAEVLEVLEHPELAELLDELMADGGSDARQTFASHAARDALQARLQRLLTDPALPRAASWFVCDTEGTQLAAVFDRPTAPTIGRNYAYRTYFHGGPSDLTPGTQPDDMINGTHLSAPLKSTATNTLKVAVSTVIPAPASSAHEGPLGILVLTVEVGNFLRFRATPTQFAVLVDGRSGDYYGAILQHPLFSRVFNEQGSLPARFGDYRVPLRDLPVTGSESYLDPLARDAAGVALRRPWIVAPAPVKLDTPRDEDTGLVVLVQQDQEASVSPVASLGESLMREALLALCIIVTIVVFTWLLALQLFSVPHRLRRIRAETEAHSN